MNIEDIDRLDYLLDAQKKRLKEDVMALEFNRDEIIDLLCFLFNVGQADLTMRDMGRIDEWIRQRCS